MWWFDDRTCQFLYIVLTRLRAPLYFHSGTKSSLVIIIAVVSGVGAAILLFILVYVCWRRQARSLASKLDSVDSIVVNSDTKLMQTIQEEEDIEDDNMSISVTNTTSLKY